MPVSQQIPKISYVGNGSTTAFPYPYKISSSADLKVYVNDALQSSGYSVSGVGAGGGGSVTFSVAPAAAARITLIRVIALERTTDYTEGGALPAAVLDDDFDRLVMMVQDVRADAISETLFNTTVTETQTAAADAQSAVAAAAASATAASNSAIAAAVAASSVNLAAPTPIGSTTPNTGAFTTLAATTSTITTSNVTTLNAGAINGTGNLTLTGGSARPNYGTAAASTTSTFTFDPATHGQVCRLTLTNAITLTFGAPTNIVEGAAYTFLLAAGDTSARTFGWNAAYKFPAATPTLATGSNTTGALDNITFIGGPTNTLIFNGSVANVR